MTSPWQPDDPNPDGMMTERRMRMAKAVSFAMLGVEDRWRDWLPRADQILDVLAVEVGAAVRHRASQ